MQVSRHTLSRRGNLESIRFLKKRGHGAMTIDEVSDQPPQLSALRHYVPLGVAFLPNLGFSKCRIAPGLEIRECTDRDKQLLRRVNKDCSSMIAQMHAVPIRHESHVICIDEQIYGQ